MISHKIAGAGFHTFGAGQSVLREMDDLLNDGLEASFPASDALSITQPGYRLKGMLRRDTLHQQTCSTEGKFTLRR